MILGYAKPLDLKVREWYASPDRRVRVLIVEGKFFVSIDGDNLCGPFKDDVAARSYGENMVGVGSAWQASVERMGGNQ